MTHDEWLKEMKAALALSRQRPLESVVRLKRLASRTARLERRLVGTWHTEQALGMAANFLGEAGRHRESVALLQKLAARHEGEIRYHGYARGSVILQAALELFESGNQRAAARLAWKGLRLQGAFPDPSIILEKVVRHLREYEQKRARPGKVVDAG